jgi:hypothetical protein
MPISLTPLSVVHRRRCADGHQIIFLARAGLASGVMRGLLTASVLQQMRAQHMLGVEAATCMDCSIDKLTALLTAPLARTLACVAVKYPEPRLYRVCRAHGALVALDSVDNWRLFERSIMLHDHQGYRGADVLLVQVRHIHIHPHSNGALP